MASYYCTKCVPDWKDREVFAVTPWPFIRCQQCGSRHDVKHFPGDPLNAAPRPT